MVTGSWSDRSRDQHERNHRCRFTLNRHTVNVASTLPRPRRPRPCAQPGCPTLTNGTYCPRHTPVEAPRPSSHQRGYDRYWRRLSARILRARPRCECADPDCNICAGHCTRRSTDVDHKVPVRMFTNRRAADSPENLQALCHQCHSAKTARYDVPR